MITDEAKFTLEPDNKRIRIWPEQGTRNQPQNITEYHAFRGGTIIVWAGNNFNLMQKIMVKSCCSLL